MKRKTRAWIFLSGTAVLVAMAPEDYAHLRGEAETAAARAFAMVDRHVVKPVRLALASADSQEITSIPSPRPAIRPSLLDDSARQVLNTVTIPDLKSAAGEIGASTQTVSVVAGGSVGVQSALKDSIVVQPDRHSAVPADHAPGVTTPAIAVAPASLQPGQVVPPLPVHAAAPSEQVAVRLSGPQSAEAKTGEGAVPEASSVRTKAGGERAGDEMAAVPPPAEKPDAGADAKPMVAANLLFGAVKGSSPLAARSIGYYSRGCLSGAKALPIDGPAWQAMRLSRNRNWGHPNLIKLLERFAGEVQKEDGWSGLLVGDLSQPRGGPMLTGHASHQIGLDADIWFTPMPGRRLSQRERENLSATSMIDGPTKVDPTVFKASHVKVVKRAASYPEVERILVHPAIKKALCEAAGKDRKWLGKVRPYFGHHYHFHIRVSCPGGSPDCRQQAAPDGDDGCGKELDEWFARLTKPPEPTPPGYKPPPPKPPMTLADLPSECKVVLESGDGAVVKDEAELVKSSLERSKKMIDMSGPSKSEASARKLAE